MRLMGTIVSITIDNPEIYINDQLSKTKVLSPIDGIITQDVTGIGIGVPGIVDQESGIIYDIQIYWSFTMLQS